MTEVRGFGRQYGRLAAGQAAAATGLLPKVRLDIVVLGRRHHARPGTGHPTEPSRRHRATSPAARELVPDSLMPLTRIAA